MAKRMEFHARNGPNAPSNRTRPPLLTAWRQVETLLARPLAAKRFGGMVIWEIPVEYGA
jgi:hypothetical protein